MKLMSLKSFQRNFFAPGEAPTVRTLKRWIDDEEIAGRKIGGKYFVDAEKFQLTDNHLVNKVLLAS